MKLSKAILATFTYHDIFDYPLTQEEIHRYLIETKATPKRIANELQKLVKRKKVVQNKNYFYLERRARVVAKRKMREKYSMVKLRRAHFYANLLRLIPSVKLVAISGALAMQNSDKNDDIDLVIVTSAGKLWTARFLANLLLWPVKRKPYDKTNSNKACLNLFLDELNLIIKDQNIYTAHEICQLKPIWDRSGTYQRFIKSNSWVKKYLQNWASSYQSKKIFRDRNYLTALNFLPLEALAKWGQLKYMKSKITTEKVGDTQLFFHPKDTMARVLNEYSRRVKKLTVY